MAYSFYGDLLDISGMFKFSPNLTQASIDEFCSTIFDEIDSDWIARSGTQILEFSNNFFMWGIMKLGRYTNWDAFFGNFCIIAWC